MNAAATVMRMRKTASIAYVQTGALLIENRSIKAVLE